MISRRKFIRVVGGGAVVVAAAGGGLTQCDKMPAAAVAGWRDPGTGETDPRRRALAHAILAPNAHNMQPWLVDLSEADAITLYVDRTRLLPETDPAARQIVISHGTFLELLVLAAAAQGYRADVTPFPRGPFAETPDDRPVARIDFHRDRAIKVDPLYAQIPHRRSNKEPYDPDRTLEPTHERALLAAYDDAGLAMATATDPAQVERLRQIADQAMTLEMATERTHLESIERTRIGASEIARHRDGIDLHGPIFWWGQRLGFYTRAKARQPGTFAYQAGLDYTKSWTESVVAFGWITSGDNERATQLATGRAYVRVNLQASATGVAMHPLSHVLQEYPEMTELQRRFLSETKTPRGHTVQMFFRPGYAATPPPSPRRDLNDLVRA